MGNMGGDAHPLFLSLLQVEHVLMLLANARRGTSSPLDAAPVDKLHAKMFTNYLKWCRHLEVRPQFAAPPDPGAAVGGKAAERTWAS